MSATDISKPSYATSSSNRLLLLKLTDGRISCKAMEHKQCNQLNDTLLPGTKVGWLDLDKPARVAQQSKRCTEELACIRSPVHSVASQFCNKK